MIPEWSGYYLDYRYLKKTQKPLKLHSSASKSDQYLKHSMASEFSNAFQSELSKVNSFYTTKIGQFKKEFDSVNSFLHSLRRETSLNDLEIKGILTVKNFDDSQSRATSMRRSFSELILHLSWLEVFCEMNYLAFKKLAKKYSNQDLLHVLDTCEMRTYDIEIKTLKENIYSLFADELLSGNVQLAINLLVLEKHFKASDVASISFCIGFMTIMLSLVVFMAVHNGIDGFFPSISLFRPFYCFSFMFMGTSWIVYYLDKNRVNWLFIFDIAISNKVSYIQILKFSLFLVLLCVFMTAFNMATIFYFQFGPGNFVPLIFAAIYILILITPHSVYKSGRYQVLSELFQVFVPVFGKVRFFNYLIGCWLTSLVIPLKDIYLGILFYCSDSWKNNQSPVPDQKILIIITMMPYLLRIFQNIKRVVLKTGLLQRQIANCLRYCVAIAIFLLAYLGFYTSPWWIIFYFLGTSVLLYYDVCQDWQINLKFCYLEYGNRVFSKSFYYFSVFFNSFLRFFSVATLLPSEVFENKYVPQEIIITVIAFLEIFRKIIWTVIRIERERADNKERFRNFDYSSKIY